MRYKAPCTSHLPGCITGSPSVETPWIDIGIKQRTCPYSRIAATARCTSRNSTAPASTARFSCCKQRQRLATILFLWAARGRSTSAFLHSPFAICILLTTGFLNKFSLLDSFAASCSRCDFWFNSSRSTACFCVSIVFWVYQFYQSSRWVLFGLMLLSLLIDKIIIVLLLAIISSVEVSESTYMSSYQCLRVQIYCQLSSSH